jgi:RHS repeat-associated protein
VLPASRWPAFPGGDARNTHSRDGLCYFISYTTNPLDQYTNVNGQSQSHDLDGNVLTMQLAPTAPIIVNGYDSENRMVSTETTGNTRLDNRYDPLHRRVLKQVSTWDSGTSSWVLQKTVRFTYDGWNVIEEEQLQAGGSGFQPLSVTRYTWGTDVSGTLQGAGGVGGLLRADETVGTNAATTHYYWYDGNGNVTGLMRSNGTVDATHRYTAFGGKAQTTVTAGTYAERNRYRFSTKYLDDEVETVEGTYYYGYRHYLTALGRWDARDLIGESGGINLYGMVGNNTLSFADVLGMQICCRNGGQPRTVRNGVECCPDKIKVDPKTGEEYCEVAKINEKDRGGGGGGGCRDGYWSCIAGVAANLGLDLATNLLPPGVDIIASQALAANGIKYDPDSGRVEGNGPDLQGLSLNSAEFYAETQYEQLGGDRAYQSQKTKPKKAGKLARLLGAARVIKGLSALAALYDFRQGSKRCAEIYCD